MNLSLVYHNFHPVLLKMGSHTFGAFIDVESSPASPQSPRPPQKAVAKTYHSVPLPSAPEALELNDLEWGTHPSGHRSQAGVASPSGIASPSNDIEMSRPASPANEGLDGVDALQSFSNPPKNRYRMVSVSLMNFLGGLSDSAPGALIPYMEKYIFNEHGNLIL